MAIEQYWNSLQRDGYAGLRDVLPDDGLEAFYLSLAAHGHGDRQRAVQYMEQALAFEPHNLVFAAAVRYLRLAAAGKQGVYTAPEAFVAFIRGGGNVPLYRAVSAALRRSYHGYGQLSVLDIGVGDGMALLPALSSEVSELTLVEPSRALLAQTLAQLETYAGRVGAHAETLQAFAQHAQGRWDLAQATFSLQSIVPEERTKLLGWLRRHTERLLVVEFDVPGFDAMFAPDHVRSVLERMSAGIAEYDHDRELVTQGFLMPLMFGFFDPSAGRTNYEQPRAAWAAQLRAAGFGALRSRTLYPYWWAPAFLIDASREFIRG